MKKQLSLLIMALTIVSMIMVQGQAIEPVRGKMDLQFNLGFPGPQTEVPDWVGTVNINGVQYGMAFFNIGSGKSFDNSGQGKTSFFGEHWFIYASIDYSFNGQGVLTQFNPGQVVLNGTDQGVVSFANNVYRMNGEVTYANGIFQVYLGSTIHMSGLIEWYANGAPEYAPGNFRIN